MSEKRTLNIYEILEALNDKINSNRNQINTIKLQLGEIKVYLLEKIEHKAKESLDFLNSELKKESFENRKHINSKHERLVTDVFKKLKTDINKDLGDLANKVMNSRIL